MADEREDVNSFASISNSGGDNDYDQLIVQDHAYSCDVELEISVPKRLA